MTNTVNGYIGAGWDQWVAFVTLLGMLAAAVSTAVITWLRWRLRRYFATKSEHEADQARQDDRHKQNTARLAQVEAQMADLATKHSLKGVEQKLVGVQLNQDKLFSSLAEIHGQLGGLRQSNDNVERLMGLVLDHMLQRDPK